MFHTLLTLALIPFALLGVYLLVVIGWAVLPYGMALIGAAVALVLHDDRLYRDAYGWALLVMALGFAWSVKRLSK